MMWTGFIWLRIGPVVYSCDQGNELSASKTGGEFLGKLDDYQLLKDCSMEWRLMLTKFYITVMNILLLQLMYCLLQRRITCWETASDAQYFGPSSTWGTSVTCNLYQLRHRKLNTIHKGHTQVEHLLILRIFLRRYKSIYSKIHIT
jgi:hypothetical protein